MGDSPRDKRLDAASDLNDALHALMSVPPDKRTGFVHDRLMSAIDDICKPAQGARASFSAQQIEILKEISFRIVYILDPMNRPQRGFFRKLWAEWKEASPFKKLSTAFAAAGAIWLVFTGAWQQVKPFIGWEKPAASAAPVQGGGTKTPSPPAK